MKFLMISTALCLSMATSAFAESPMSGFIDYTVGKSDLMASEFIGMRVYNAEGDVDIAGKTMVAAETEWDDIGEINDLVISQDGDVMAVIVGVGGFLGMGEKDVALTMDQIHVMREADNPQDIFLVVRSSSEALKAAPGFKREMTKSNTDMGSSQKPMALVAPKVEREGYTRSDRSGLTADMLTDARVYGANGEDVGEISSLLLDNNGAIDRAVIDVGGFLGIGEKPVAVSFDELTVLRKEDGDEVQVFIESSKEALESLPAYEK